ncbi:hypothetical protein F0562_017626 [Nyssa sinensis]|uniref:Uncharacterized protein n=1 Tax=Nyssa sinensis TaxID=561372 RepID=A0A5J4ZFJ6_9ASTE|nr:hypothetical protein F0562_017626 [Nyssa sinensis]
MAADIACSILGKIAEYLVEPIGRQFGYLLCYNSNIENFKSEVDKLENMRVGVELRVVAGRSNSEIVGPDVEAWLTRVNEMSREAEQVVQAKPEVEKGCFNGWCPAVKSRYSLSRKAKKNTELVVKLQADGNFDMVSYPPPPVGMPSTSTGGFKGLESRISTTEEVLKALKDDEINMIGICGMGGVGKTTMVKEVAEKAKAESLFDEIVMAVVSQNPDLKKIQREIADMLGLRFNGENVLERSGELCRRLTNGNRILVILDDVWEGLDLGEVGIPLGGDRKRCKVVLTSRLQRVCSEMGVQMVFTVKLLSAQEAWYLFKEMAGNSVDTTDIHHIAREIVNECKGLPIALVTLGKALKNRGEHAWNDALQQLSRSTVTNISEMQKHVYLSIELSYNYLQSAQAKSLLLLCCLFPEDYNIWIEDLVRYGVGLRLFEDVETVAQARNRVYSVIDELRSCNLLLAGDAEFVTLHDIVRDAGISIASKGEHSYMVRHDTRLKEWPQKESYEHYTAISLTFSEIRELPGGLACPNLKLLQLACNLPFLDISRNFFGGMRELCVIGFKRSILRSLPSSLQFLINLRTLCLDSCACLMHPSIIGRLKKLEILSFFNSKLDELPQEIEQLSNLKLLDLRLDHDQGPRRIPAGVLSNLSKLEELYIGKCFSQWNTEEMNIENASITELNSLSCLETLEISVDAMLLPGVFCFEKLKRFQITVGTKFDPFPQYGFPNSLTLNLLDMSVLSETDINVLLKRTAILTLEVKGLKNVVNELDLEGFRKLKELSLYQCTEVEYLIDAMNLVLDNAFVNLESLELGFMDNLKEICNGNLPAGSFGRLQKMQLSVLPAMKNLWWGSIQPECLGNLRFLHMNECDAMKTLFTPSIVKGLVQLKVLEIFSCEMMQEIVSKEGGEDEKGAEKIEFPKLNHLALKQLPKLRSFYPKSNIQGSKNDNDGATPPLLNQKVILCSMERLDIAGLNNLMQITEHDQMQTNSFHKLRIMWIWDCEKLLHVVAYNQTAQFQNLEELSVMNCGSLEALFDTKPRLSAEVRMVPKEIHGLKNLRYLRVEECANLKYLLAPSVAKLLVKLQEIQVWNCRMMEGVIGIEEEEEEAKEIIFFSELKVLYLQRLPNLESFVSGFYTYKLPALKTLSVTDCPKLKAFHSVSQSAEQVKTVDVGINVTLQESNFNTSPQHPLFNEMVTLRSVEELYLAAMNNLVQIVDDEMQAGSLHRLRVIKVNSCEKLMTIASSNSIKLLQNLEELGVGSCGELEAVFDFNGLKVNQGHAEVAFNRLRSLVLERLPKLTHVWRMVPRGIRGFQNLTSLEVEKCDNLRSLLSPSTSKLLVKLQELKLKNCKMMEEVIETEAEGETTKMILFPELCSLTLNALPNLENFVSGSYTSKFPSLKILKVYLCPKLKAFHLKSRSAQKVKTADASTSEKLQEGRFNTATLEHFFNEKATFPGLEFFVLYDVENLDVIWHSQLPDAYFCKLREIKVTHCRKLLNIIPWNFLPRLGNLESLFIDGCASLQEVFEDGHSVTFSNLREMTSECPPKPPHVDDRNLGFRNLRELTVFSCGSLRNLLSPFMARSLLQLQKLAIYNCEMLEEIVTNRGEERIDKFVFPQLIELNLDHLKNLITFCSGNHDFEFPSLKKVLIQGCPKMKTFCSGQLSAPELERVDTQYFGGSVWMGDLNSTIQHLAQERL